jgi:hypothetical protein
MVGVEQHQLSPRSPGQRGGVLAGHLGGYREISGNQNGFHIHTYLTPKAAGKIH